MAYEAVLGFNEGGAAIVGRVFDEPGESTPTLASIRRRMSDQTPNVTSIVSDVTFSTETGELFGMWPERGQLHIVSLSESKQVGAVQRHALRVTSSMRLTIGEPFVNPQSGVSTAPITRVTVAKACGLSINNAMRLTGERSDHRLRMNFLQALSRVERLPQELA